MKILVTGATRNTGMAVIRGLTANGCDIIGADERSLPFKLHSHYTGPYYIHPQGYGDDFVDAIIKILKKEAPDVLLPASGSKTISKHKPEIEQYSKVLLPEFSDYMKAFDNLQTMKTCKQLNIDCPEIVAEKDVLQEIEKNTGRKHPVRFVLKPCADIGGARGIGVFADKKSFEICKTLGEQYGKTFIQEYIPGPAENMRTVNLLFDARNQLVTYFTTRKIRQWPNSGGISALTVSSNEPELVRFILPFFEASHWQGFAEAEIKVDARDGRPKLIEINPRFCGYIGFPIACGVNFPWYICQLLTGQHPETAGYASGIKYVHWSTYLKAVYSEWQGNNNNKGFFSKIRSEIKGKKVSNNIDWYDWKVIAAKMLFELTDRGKSTDVWN